MSADADGERGFSGDGLDLRGNETIHRQLLALLASVG